VNQKTLLIVYYDYVHAIVIYRIIFWGNSPYSINIFYIKKKVIRIITGTSNRDSSNDLVKLLKIVHFQSQYIYSLLCFITSDMDLQRVL
jgi:hypothetical protein